MHRHTAIGNRPLKLIHRRIDKSIARRRSQLPIADRRSPM
jgi:hypothetical protein